MASFLQCSRCDAHIGLLTQDDGTGELQYYANGLSLTFSPKDKQSPNLKEMPNTLSKKYHSEMDNQNISSRLSMDQLWQRAGAGRNFN